MVKKNCFVVMLILVFLVVLSGSAFAWTAEITGKPFRFALGSGATGYYVWQDDYGFHL